MRNNETGEYELVVGNKQLLSGFFIVVVLCAVAFAMGYVVGQNSPRTAKLASDQPPAGVAQDARPQPASPVVPVASPPAPQSEAPSTRRPDCRQRLRLGIRLSSRLAAAAHHPARSRTCRGSGSPAPAEAPPGPSGRCSLP